MTGKKIGTHVKQTVEKKEDAKLKWATCHEITIGTVTATIQSSVHRSGRMLYSFSVSRAPFKEGQSPSKHFRPDDIQHLDEVTKAVQVYLENPSHVA